MFKGFDRLFAVKPFSHKNSHLIALPRELIYQTVLDVPSYSRFLPWCEESVWIDDKASSTAGSFAGQRLARLTVDFKIFRESYVSKVSFEANNYIKAVAADSSMFDILDTVWEFKEQGKGTLINFSIKFNFHKDIYQTVSTSLSHVLTNKMFEHFIRECHLRYRNQTNSNRYQLKCSSTKNP